MIVRLVKASRKSINSSASLQAVTSVVKANGGTVLGSIKHPLGASDFSSCLMQAQASEAQIPGLANAGGNTSNSIKAAREFGIDKHMRVVAMDIYFMQVKKPPRRRLDQA